MKPFLSIVLPVQNEAEFVSRVIMEIEAMLTQSKIDYELVVVENGSTDESLAVLKKLALINPRVKVGVSSPGYGRAVVYGLNQAKGEYLSYMPSDGQVDIRVIPRLVELVKTNKYDLVKVYRISRESLVRKYVSWMFNQLAKSVFGLRVKDINASPKVFKSGELRKLNLKSKDSFLDTELLIKAKKFDWKIKEVPMENLKRVGGKSTVKPKII
ncbi:glycosyltransferase family 2 protein, partial [Patescibacteria group bacterium]|nr:glycosyltransferase family 2 protein [Patescibacteria group bacterium]